MAEYFKSLEPSEYYSLQNKLDELIDFYDMEHGELKNIASFEDYIKNISSYMQKLIEGDI